MTRKTTSCPVTLAGILLNNPTVLASGILGLTASSLVRVAEAGAGAVTVKSCGLEPRKGHKGPTVVPYGSGLLNAVGLSNPGAVQVGAEIREFRSRCAKPIFASIFGRTIAEFGEVAAVLAAAAPHLIEVNVSCPNVESEMGTPFGLDFDATQEITAVVKARSRGIPVAIKLSPQCNDIGRLARLCQDAGADAITAINTVGPGMLIDVKVMRPVLGNRVGGMSGPAILPIAVRAVFEIFKQVTIPIIGTGGVSSANDALQMIMAGATAVGIGTAVRGSGLRVFADVAAGIRAFLEGRGLAETAQIRGVAHGS